MTDKSLESKYPQAAQSVSIKNPRGKWSMGGRVGYPLNPEAQAEMLQRHDLIRAHETKQETRDKNNLKLKKIAVGSLIGLTLLGGVAEGKHNSDLRSATEHKTQELMQFSFPSLAGVYVEKGIKPENVTLLTVNELQKSPFDIARNMRAKDVSLVAEEIFNQLDGKIIAGDQIVLPNDQLNPIPRRLV